jgi:hypothetical protein
MPTEWACDGPCFGPCKSLKNRSRGPGELRPRFIPDPDLKRGGSVRDEGRVYDYGRASGVG